MHKKVSIIITNYKKEAFLKRAIKSCLKQTYRNIEIIVIDDCSNKEKCIRLIRGYNRANIRFMYTTKNYGHYMCCNYAMDKATGYYITFLGGDDRIEKEHIQSLVSSLRSKKNAVASLCLYHREDTDGNKVGKNKLCEASILFEKNKILKNIGYFHAVRFAGDTEYRERMQTYYGKSRIINTNKVTYKALYLKNSLTRSEKTKGGSLARAKYVRCFQNYLKKSSLDNLYFDYKGDMPFGLNNIIKTDNFDSIFFKEFVEYNN
tara:strand:- start:2217 stop:3002 length:786 start_codon:yes stop_codon:yes gene_type:complete